MKRSQSISVFIVPIFGALVACDGSGKDRKNPLVEAGMSGETQDSGGDDAQAKDREEMNSAQRPSAAASSTAGGAVSFESDAGTDGGTDGGASREHADQDTREQTNQDTREHTDQDIDSSAPVEGVPGTSSFTRFTVRTKYTPPTGSAVSPCDTSTWSFARTTQTLIWDFCKGDSTEPEQGSRALTDAETRAVLNTLSLLHPTEEATCIADASYSELELEVDGMSTLFQSAHPCGPVSSGTNFVSSMYHVVEIVEWLSYDSQLPPMPTTLTLSTGEVVPSLAPDLCIADPREYKIDLATGSVSWGLCMADPDTGERVAPLQSTVLDPTELESVLIAYGELELGATGSCETLEPPQSLDVINGRIASLTVDEELELVDEAGSCYRGGGGAGYATGVTALAQLVNDFVE